MFLLKQSTHRMTIQHDPVIGHRYVPNLNARINNEAGGYFVRTNSDGFRSDVEFKKAKSDQPRILFFGDSFIAGDECDNAQRFSDICGDLLNVETFNYGLSGSGTDQQLLIYEHFAKDIEQDIVVIGVMVENIDRITLDSRPSIDRTTGKMVRVPKPFFKLTGGKLELQNTPVSKERKPFEKKEQSQNVVSSLVSSTNSLIKKVTGSTHSKLRSSLVKLSGYTPQPQYKNADHPDLKLMKAILDRFIEQASAKAKVVVVPIPNPHYLIDGVKPHYKPFFEQFDNPVNGVHLYDITSDLMKLSWEERERMNFDIDNHFSPEGHRVMANHISSYISKTFNGFTAKSLDKPVKRNRKNPEDTYVLGISCFYHNSAASLIRNGEIIAAAEEERFTRVKNDKGFPSLAVNFCLEEAGIHQEDLDAIVYYDDFNLTFERLISSQVQLGEGSGPVWEKVMPSWLSYKLHIPELVRKHLLYDGPILKDQHHRSHAASAFYPSNFTSAAILTLDGVGEWATATIGKGNGNEIEILEEMNFPNSLGLLYSAFTQFTGFKVNSGEYKMMGLAPYGDPIYVDAILNNIVHINDDGSIKLNMDYFDFLGAKTMTNHKWDELFGGPAMDLNGRLTKREFDIAKSAQVVTEMAIIKMANHAHKLTGEKRLCMAGGVALNCVANGKILENTPFEEIWIQPAAGDSGCALGAAIDVYYNHFGNKRILGDLPIQMGSYWGPGFSNQEVISFLETFDYPYETYDSAELYDRIAGELEKGKVVGHMAGRCEFGPRALGNRSILGDSRNTEMQSTLNLKIKFRESFRPFAPSVLEEDSPEYFDLEGESPYMLLVAPVKESRCIERKVTATEDLLAIVNEPRSDVPAITHVDYSARIQTIKKAFNPRYHELISGFKAKTGYGLIVNTSFNVRGEPIVLTPYDAYRCFMRTNMDVLVMENCILYKEMQPEWPEEMGVGLEDVEIETEKTDENLIRDLKSAFATSMLPIIRDMAGKDLLHINDQTPSTWSTALSGAFNQTTFVIPQDQLNNLSNGAMLKAITTTWKNTDLAASFVAHGASVEKLAETYKKDFSQFEEVDDSIYVMF